jgi:hypothetical protein
LPLPDLAAALKLPYTALMEQPVNTKALKVQLVPKVVWHHIQWLTVRIREARDRSHHLSRAGDLNDTLIGNSWTRCVPR